MRYILIAILIGLIFFMFMGYHTWSIKLRVVEDGTLRTMDNIIDTGSQYNKGELYKVSGKRLFSLIETRNIELIN